MTDHPPDTVPSVLFLCVHNAGRSQMAAGWARHLGGESLEVRSGGSEPADSINPSAVAAMAESGIDIKSQSPSRWTDGEILEATVVITMGCGDTCPIYPGKRYEDWPVPDPAGQSVEDVRPIRDEIEGRVRRLLESLDIA
ncbi:MAG: arsenate reductase ArsC [Acidimicrobiia bacterium]|nr:arsenate reductase ArsC [Acidimicrobiia bacterium]